MYLVVLEETLDKRVNKVKGNNLEYYNKTKDKYVVHKRRSSQVLAEPYL